MAEAEDQARSGYRDQFLCFRCPTIFIEKGPKLLEHMSGHLLYDNYFTNMLRENPCSLCLSTGGKCGIRLRKTRGRDGAWVIDMDASHCKNLCRISLGHAGKASKSSPCTNIPLNCPLCPNPSDAIWQYSFFAHLRYVHPNADPNCYKDLYIISDEERAQMKEKYNAKSRLGHKRKAKVMAPLSIADEHTSRVALQYVPFWPNAFMFHDSTFLYQT